MDQQRRIVLQLCTLAALSGRWYIAGAERYPSRPIKIVVSSGAGSTVDSEVRRIAQSLAKTIGQPVIVENRSGGSNTIGATLVAQSKADGYTILAGSPSAISVAPVLMSKLAYHPIRSFHPITQCSRNPFILVVNPTLGVRTAQELITLAKAKPGNLAYASNGLASVLHLMAEVFCRAAGVAMLHVPYKTTVQTLISIMANETQTGFDFPMTSVPHIKSGKLKALLVTGNKRVPLLPDVPSAYEAGFKDLDFTGWLGLMAPAGTPKDTVARLNAAIAAVLRMPDMQAYYASTGREAVGSSPEEFRAFIAAELARMERIVKLTGVRMEQ